VQKFQQYSITQIKLTIEAPKPLICRRKDELEAYLVGYRYCVEEARVRNPNLSSKVP